MNDVNLFHIIIFFKDQISPWLLLMHAKCGLLVQGVLLDQSTCLLSLDCSTEVFMSRSVPLCDTDTLAFGFQLLSWLPCVTQISTH